jgi:hypothetical protein
MEPAKKRGAQGVGRNADDGTRLRLVRASQLESVST